MLIGYKAHRLNQTIDRVGVTTDVPGLLLDTALDPCRGDFSLCWVLVHQSSSLILPWCWDAFKDALTFAALAADLGDWRKDGNYIRHVVLSSRAHVLAYLEATHGQEHMTAMRTSEVPA